MDECEEVTILIKRWLEAVFDIKINSIGDLDSGQYYLEVLYERFPVIIPNERYKKYEAIENSLDEFYKTKTNNIVCYEQLIGNGPPIEDVICLCILIFGIFRDKTKASNKLINSDYQQLVIIYEHIMDFLEKGVLIDRKEIINTIKNISSNEDPSFNSKMHNSSKSSFSESNYLFKDDQMQNKKTTRSDDENEDSFNIASVTSETNSSNFRRHNTSYSRRSKPLSDNRRMNLSIRNSHVQKFNSPRVKESQIRKLEENIKHYQSNIHDLKKDLTIETSKNNSLTEDIKQWQMKTRGLNDQIDLQREEIEDMYKIISKKDTEIEKASKLINQMKQETLCKSDEIIQMKLAIKDLHGQINSLNNKLQFRTNENDALKMAEIDYAKCNEDLKNENKRLKSQLDEYCRESQSKANNAKGNFRDDESTESGVPFHIVEGESMDVINEFKFAEMQDKYSKEIEDYQKEVEALKDEIESSNRNTNNLKLQLKIIDDNYKEALSEIRDYSSKLDDANKLLKETDKHETIKENTIIQLPDLRRMGFKDTAELLSDLLSNSVLPIDEKKLLLKHISRVLNIEYFDDDGRHADIENLYKIVAELKQSNERKVRENESLHNQYDDLEHHFQIISEELETQKNKTEDLTRFCQMQKAKFDDDQFKLKMVLVNMREEKNGLSKRYSDVEHKYCSLQIDHDSCLQKLNNLSKDCHDYIELIKEITERESKVYRNIGCQTNFREEYVNIGTNVMSPRTPNISRGHSLRYKNRNAQHTPEIARQRQSPHIAISNNIIANKSLHSLRNPDNNTYNNRRTIDPSFHQAEHEFSDIRKYEDKSARQFINDYNTHDYNTYQNQNYDRDYPGQQSDNRGFDKKILKEKFVTKRDSPSVKPERLNEMWSRNNKQPAHLKSSYPTETQGINIGYVANVLMDKMKVPMDDELSEVSHDNHANKGHTARYSTVDPMNLRTEQRNRGLYQNNDDMLVDDLLKENNLDKKMRVLSARSMNNQPPVVTEPFKKPFVPQLTLTRPTRDSDRENARPWTSRDDGYQDHGESMSIGSSSTSFAILNSPKDKRRGMPTGCIRGHQKK